MANAPSILFNEHNAVQFSNLRHSFQMCRTAINAGGLIYSKTQIIRPKNCDEFGGVMNEEGHLTYLTLTVHEDCLQGK